MTSPRRALVLDSLPLVIGYVATFTGASYIVRNHSSEFATTYLVASVVIPQVGLWADWGRVTSILVRVQGRPNDFRRELFAILKLLPILMVPTALTGVAALLILPLSEKHSPADLVGLGIVCSLSAFLIGLGNALRTLLLLDDMRTLYFWTQLCITAGIPSFSVLFGSVGSGLLISGTLYVLLHALIWRCVGWERDVWVRQSPPSVLAFLRADRLGWSIGATQLVTAVSVASELPIIAAMSPDDLLAFYGLTRIAQGIAAVGLRPIERGLPDVVTASSAEGIPGARARQEWVLGVRRSLLFCAVGGAGLMLAGPWLIREWLGPRAEPDLLTLVFIAVVPLATALYRASAAEVLAQGAGVRLICVAVTDLVAKLSVALFLVPRLGGDGMALACLVALLLAAMVAGGARTLRTLRLAPHSLQDPTPGES